MPAPIVLAIDLVLAALIGPPGHPIERILDQVERGEYSPVLIDLALYCAMSSVQPGDVIDHARFARLLRHAHPHASQSRPASGSFDPPSTDEIEHWRDVVFGRDRD
jgi:hypothetical protein